MKAKPKSNYINCEPNWQGMFDYAIAVATAELTKEQGRMLIIHMLEFGKRLEKNQSESEVK